MRRFLKNAKIIKQSEYIPFFKDSGKTVKLEFRLFILITSILLGCVAGLLYYNQGDSFFPNSYRLDEFSSWFNSTPERPDMAEKSLKDEIRQQFAANHTLYEFTAAVEQEKAKSAASPELASPEQNEPSEIASAEANAEKMPEESAEIAKTSPKTTDTLNDSSEAQKSPEMELAQQTPEPQQIAEQKPKALINVSDYRQTTPIFDVNPIENKMEIQVQTAAEAQKSLSQELFAQAQTPAPIQTPEPVQAPAPVETLQTPNKSLEQATFNQAVGSLAPLPDKPNVPTVKENTRATDTPEDLDQNPLAVIMGLNPSENSDEAQTASSEAPKQEIAAQPQEPSQVVQQASPQPAPQVQPESNIPSNPPAEIPASPQPTRMKKPVRNQTPESVKEPAPVQKEEYSLDLYRVNLRKALASFQIATGLKVVASLDVQGIVSCKSKNSDPEVLLASLLADTQFKFVRSGNFVYVAHSNQLMNLPNPLEKTETRIFSPEYISLEELELVFRSNLTQFGTCSVSQDSLGKRCLSVTDWVLSLDQLAKIQQIVDVPAPENRVNTFVFERELDGTFKSLELPELADSQGLVLQRIAPMETENKEEKKTFIYGKKKEKSSDFQAYTISYRPDSFLASVRQQLKTQPAPMPGQTSALLALDQPMRFDFNLNVQDHQVPYQVTVTYRQNPENEEGINAEVVCAPREDLGPKAKAKDFHVTLAIPSQGRNSLILQMDLGEFPVENAGVRKDISYAMRGNRMKKEVVVVLCPFQSVPKIQKNGLSTQAVREIIRQQEVLARKFYGSMNPNEREDSRHCLGTAQRLRLSLGELEQQSFDSGFGKEL